MNHHSFCRSFYWFLFLFFLYPISSFAAIDSESDRERIASAKSKTFSRLTKPTQSFLLSGSYASDQNSKEYNLDSRYYYRSNKQMHEVNFFQETSYGNLGTTAGKTYLVKKSEQYDGMVSNKFMLFDTNNYGVLYNRANYDDLSTYYYDLRSAAGFGRVFWDDKIEFDTSVGYLDIKNSGSKIFVMPSIRLNLKLTKDLTFTQRGYLFLDYESMDDDLRTSLKYKITSKISLSFNHTIEQRKYQDQTKRVTVNNTSRYISVGLIFDLD